MKIDTQITTGALRSLLETFWSVSASKIRAVESNFDTALGAPVFTVNGKYTTRGWTEWTQGFQFGSCLIQFDATGEFEFLDTGRNNTLAKMAPHLTHSGVHDHGFNTVSTYGNLLRLMVEEKIPWVEWEKRFYELALKTSGAVQAMRWTEIPDGGFVYSFNGQHSLFVDTIRSCRILVISHRLGHFLGGENDVKINLFHRAIRHLLATAKFSIYYGEGRDAYDVRGRAAHESIFNVTDGNFRCPGSQQGYSPFSTWTRGLAWAMCGFAEQLEFLSTVDESEFEAGFGKVEVMTMLARAAVATCDFYIDHSCADGIPFWDTGAPGLKDLDLGGVSNPLNDHEPVDSSAAAIGAQGLLRLGNYLTSRKDVRGKGYTAAGLTIARTLFSEPYLSTSPEHHGLLLHSVYHRPNGWDHIPAGRKVPCGESSMWGDYHVRELALMLTRMINAEKYYTFFDCLNFRQGAF